MCPSNSDMGGPSTDHPGEDADLVQSLASDIQDEENETQRVTYPMFLSQAGAEPKPMIFCPGYSTLVGNSGHQRNEQAPLPYVTPCLVILATNPGLDAPSPRLETSVSSSRAITTQYGLALILSSASSCAEVGQSLFVGASLTEGGSRG